MAPLAKPISVSLWLLTLCSTTLAEVHRFSYLELMSPQAAPGLPKRLNIQRVDDLLFSVYDSDSGRQVPRNGYNQDRQKFWRSQGTRCQTWNSWVRTSYQALVQELNASAPQDEHYYMQVLKNCEWDNVTGVIQAVTRYALNGEDMLQHQSDQNHWFSMHPAAWQVMKRWNQGDESLIVISHITPQECKFLINTMLPFIAQKTAQPTAHVALIPGTQARPSRLVCHVTGFYPRDINVTWERGGQVAHGEQLSSGIRPNGDPTFQIQVSIELGQEGGGPTAHVCVVRHSSLGNTPLRVTWVPDSQPPGQAGVLVIVAGCILISLVIGALVWCLWKRPGAWTRLYRPART